VRVLVAGSCHTGRTGRSSSPVLGRLVVAADVSESVTEPARQLKRADDLSSGSAAVRALQPVSQDATPVPLHVGHLTQRRFLNFSPLPVSHQPPLPCETTTFVITTVWLLAKQFIPMSG
jgi:hypothetical protein